MKLKMLTRMAAMVAAGSLVDGLLAGCSVIPSKDGAADSAVATDTALILSQGDGMPALTNAEDFLNSVNVTPGGSAGLARRPGQEQRHPAGQSGLGRPLGAGRGSAGSRC